MGGTDGVEIERSRDLPMADVLRIQQLACEHVGSTLYARILDGIAADHDAGGVTVDVFAPWVANATADAIPLRLLGAVHRIVLRGDAPELGAFYPSVGGTDDGDPVPAFLATVAAHRLEIDAGMARNVQTNEAGRACSLLGGFHQAAATSGLPLRLLEVGASAGLLLRWDQFGYSFAGQHWGASGPVQFHDPFVSDATPPLASVTVASRAGCDITPIDVTTDDGVLSLRGFLWPDQVDRRARLDAAIDVARANPATVEAADAGAWVERMLATPTPGVATVIYHSIVLQYLPRESFARMRTAIEAAGAAATPDAPIFWLRMEPAGDVADVRMRSWPDGGDELLATTGYHGPPVTWLG